MKNALVLGVLAFVLALSASAASAQPTLPFFGPFAPLADVQSSSNWQGVIDCKAHGELHVSSGGLLPVPVRGITNTFSGSLDCVADATLHIAFGNGASAARIHRRKR